MKSNVLAAIMALMVLSFGINAFSDSSAGVRQITARIAMLVPQGSTGYMSPGTTLGGSSCEVSAEVHRGIGHVGITRFAMGMETYAMDLSRGQLVRHSVSATEIKIEYVNWLGEKEFWIITTSQDGTKLVALEQLEEKATLLGFGPLKIKSVVKCISAH